MQITVNGQHIAIVDDTLVSNSVNIYECEFEFDASWDGFAKTSVWQLNSGEPIEVVIDSGVAVIPHEVLENAGILRIGVYGTKDEKVMPTVWLEKRKVCLGTPTGSIGTEPTPSIYAQILAVATEAKDIAEDVQTEWESVTAEAETLPSGSSATASFDGEVFTFGIPQGERGGDGEDGADGFSPIVAVTPITNGHRVTITDAEGVHTFDVLDGTDGADGVGITNIVMNADYTLTITLSNGTSFTTPSIRGEKGETGNGIASITKTATVGKVDTYTITYTDGTTTTFDVTNGEVTEADLEEALTSRQPDLIAGSSDALLSDTYTLDTEPYLLREGKCARAYEEIVGGTVAWNQLAKSVASTSPSDITYTNNNDGSYTVNGTASADAYLVVTDSLIASHKYYMAITGNTNTKLTQLGFLVNTTSSKTIINPTGTNPIGLKVDNGSTVTNETVIPQIVDLTAMFGTTIADYIYSLEQATAGAGVAFFRKLFPKGYYEYNAGELISVSGLSSHDTVGFNQWDEEWEVGSINGNTGNPITAANCIRAKNFIPVLPNTTYFFHTPVTGLVYEYDADKNYIKYDLGSSTLSAYQFTTTPNTRYLKFRTAVGYGATYKNDICINLSWSGYRNGEYEEYQKHSYALDDSLTLRGIPKLDSSNNLYYDGDTYASDGAVTRKYGIVDLGTRTWTKGSGTGSNLFFSSGNAWTFGIPKLAGECVCPKYVNAKGKTYSTIVSGEMCIDNSTEAPVFRVRDDNYVDSTAEQFKTAMSGVYLVYELATPTTETAEPYQHLQRVGSTEEYVTTSIVPVGHNTKMLEDLKKQIEGLPWDLSMIAPIESGTKSSRAYAIGEYFLLGNQFCKAKTAIASGATFTLNTNYVVTTIATELKALQ